MTAALRCTCDPADARPEADHRQGCPLFLPQRYAERLAVLVAESPDFAIREAVERHARRAFAAVIAVHEAAVRGPWCIVDTDNFGGDYPDEQWIAVGIQHRDHAETMAEAMCARSGPSGPRSYRVVPSDYILQPGFMP